jgi:hypothetical protein
MAKRWVLDTDTKGTGAHMVPLEKVLEREDPPPRERMGAKPAPAGRTERPPTSRRPAAPAETKRTPLPAGHVRNRTTGEIGKVQAVDPKAGTATVRWLKRGSISTVPLASVSRR